MLIAYKNGFLITAQKSTHAGYDMLIYCADQASIYGLHADSLCGLATRICWHGR